MAEQPEPGVLRLQVIEQAINLLDAERSNHKSDSDRAVMVRAEREVRRIHDLASGRAGR
ncbi:MAG: hypothetical protein OXF41_20750 [bacterium]|nr:hypothetical protein [bacterium]